MNLTAHVHYFDDADVWEGDITGGEQQTHELHAGPTETVRLIEELADANELERMEWSSYPDQREGDWLSLSGRWIGSYCNPNYDHVTMSIHGSLAQLRRLMARWSR